MTLYAQKKFLEILFKKRKKEEVNYRKSHHWFYKMHFQESPQSINFIEKHTFKSYFFVHINKSKMKFKKKKMTKITLDFSISKKVYKKSILTFSKGILNYKSSNVFL